MEQKQFAPKSHNCFYEAKKPLFCFIVAKNGSTQKKIAPIWISPETSPEISEQFFILLKHCSKFFPHEVILPESSLEMSEQNFCTNIA
jgi:hypothetical protein